MAKILIVDDAAFMRMMVKDTLKKNGYTDFCEAPDGAEALKLYQEIKPDRIIKTVSSILG